MTTGVVAVTKSDLADPELALLEAAELFPERRSGRRVGPDGRRPGRAASRARASRSAPSMPARRRRPAAALHIDRVFTIRGAGTVVTGTLWSGAISARRRADRPARPATRRASGASRSTTSRSRPRAAGQRVAVNLTGLATDEIDRGDVLVAGDGGVRPSYRIDAELEFDADSEPDTGDRVQVHHGTREAPARLTWLGGRFWQIRLEQPLLPARRRPAGGPADRAARHARRRPRARPRPAPARSESRADGTARTVRPRRSAGTGRTGPSPAPRTPSEARPQEAAIELRTRPGGAPP